MTDASNFRDLYRSIYSRFGFPLEPNHGIGAADLDATEKVNGIALPRALREYYEVAGREEHFNSAHNRIHAPCDWRVDGDRLVFMEENQGVVLWSASLNSADDPTVWQAFNDDKLEWFEECERTSVFLAVMLHYQAVQGGMSFVGMSYLPDDMDESLESGRWTCFGTVNRLTAYSRDGQVVCTEPEMGLMVGANSEASVFQLEREFDTELEML